MTKLENFNLKQFIKEDLERRNYKSCNFMLRFKRLHYCYLEAETGCGYQDGKVDSEFGRLSGRLYHGCKL